MALMQGTAATSGPDITETVLVLDGGRRPYRRWLALLQRPGRQVLAEKALSEAFRALHNSPPDLMFVSLDLPELEGVRAIDVFRERAPEVPIIAMAETPTVNLAVACIRHGAVDLLPITEGRAPFSEAASRALQEARSSRELDRVRDQVRDRYGFSQLLTQSPRMLQVFDQIRAVAPTDATVLIRGETGTGKELVSRAIHERSRRKDNPFISVNCGAFTESLLESELFGHEKGSFTGAIGKREGLFEMASHGTLFLDELGETTLNVQVNLLRVLEDMTFRRVGGRDQITVDVRIVAATNVDLETAVAENAFREDLFYRLNVFPILLPPLRERSVDIPLLMRHFLDEIAVDYDLEPPVVAAEALNTILRYRWPGNVRELRSMCERWVITHSGKRLEREALPHGMLGERSVPVPDTGVLVDDTVALKNNLERVVESVERTYLYRVLKEQGGHMERTARHAGITRRTLYNKMKLYAFKPGDFKAQP